jgi:ATP-dependent Lon protease
MTKKRETKLSKSQTKPRNKLPAKARTKSAKSSTSARKPGTTAEVQNIHALTAVAPETASEATQTTVETSAQNQEQRASDSTLPRLSVLPLRDVVFFPYVVMPLLVGRQASLMAIDEAIKRDDKFILLVAQKNGDIQEPKSDDLYTNAVVGRIVQIARLPNGATKVLIEGVSRVIVDHFVEENGTLFAHIIDDPLLPDPEEDPQLTRVAAERALELFEEYVGLQRRIPPEVVVMVQSTNLPDRQAYGIAAHVATKQEMRQRLLASRTLSEAFAQLTELLGGEIEVLRLERKIDDETRGAMFQNQREFYLQEQLKAIHRELGQEDTDDFQELEAQVRKKMLPEAVRNRVQREIRKLRRMSPMSPEYTVSRNFVDWIASLPWDERTDETLDLAHARRVLDADHYGLEDVKDRVLDFIAVLSLVGRIEGPILCLVGPPGVGKTSLGRSIARALGRKFVRMSLGGVRDEAEIRGHRRTYIGSMPGRIIQSMRKAEVVNPVILLDEIDKLGQDYRGDPAAALLEVLDPEQNFAFNDHYLEVDYDLSQVLFITTANSLNTIPEPLRDRMEIIRIPGYLDQEKLAIARQYLVPRQLQANGIELDEVEFDPDVLPTIMRSYTREAGVREFERKIARVARKLARRQAESETLLPKQHVTVDDLKTFLGTPQFDINETELEDKVGVANGLAYTQTGGDTLQIEVAVVRGRGKVSLTGTLGNVMKESASAAISYIRSRAEALGIPKDFHRTRDIHIHIPDGATPKDGPSAGIAIATAVVSALTGRFVCGDIAMTGEITLRGRVLPIGGLKEKSVAAHRNLIKHVIIPHANARDVDELPEEVRNAVSFHPVKSMDEVLAIALRPVTDAPDGKQDQSYATLTTQ